jgi:hypothetical protein
MRSEKEVLKSEQKDNPGSVLEAKRGDFAS